MIATSPALQLLLALAMLLVFIACFEIVAALLRRRELARLNTEYEAMCLQYCTVDGDYVE